MGSQLLLVLAFVYAGLLFLAAWQAERIRRVPPIVQAVIYSLSLAVYCSSWTFFGAVDLTVANGWAYLPIYLGPICLFVFGSRFLRRLLVVSSRNKITSVADFIGSRYGKQQWLASLVTLVAVVGTLPYIALQLKAVAMAWGTISSPAGSASAVTDSTSFVTALVMAWFAILFGTRVIDGPHRLRGMVTAVALESLVKLVAFIALGLAAIYWLAQADSGSLAQHLPINVSQIVNVNFVTQTFLSMVAIFCLPRQFHVMVVEHHTRNDFRYARWLFPVYLVLVSVLVLPISAAGNLIFGAGAAADMTVLSLPLASDSLNLAALVFIGGLSAATGMVVVATVTLSIMISNELFVPIWLRLGQRIASLPDDLGSSLRHVRRFSIVVILLLGWVLERTLVGNPALASLGLISFAAAAQLSPAIVAALYWPAGHRNGVIAGLLSGGALWAYCLLMPSLLGRDHPLVLEGPMAIGWLAPQSLLGSGWLDPLSHGVFWSLLANTLVFVVVSKFSRANVLDQRQANAFTQMHYKREVRIQDFEPTEIEIRQLQSVMDPLIGQARREQIWSGFEQRLGHRLLPHDRAPRFVVREVESALAAIIGAVSAHRSIELLRKQQPLPIEDFARLMGGSSRQMQFSQELLQITLETIPQGISVVDHDMQLVAWNTRYRDLFHYPPRLLYVGCPIAKIYEFNASRGYLGSTVEDVDTAVGKRLQLMTAGTAYRIERRLPDGKVIEINGTPMANGGYVATYTDITDYQQVLDELETAKSQLEARVAERTAELSDANLSLQKENQLRARLEQDLNAVYASKNRFLAAASHDLLQPINAARLFVSSLQQKTRDLPTTDVKSDVQYIDSALVGAESLINSLREIARLDSGKQTPQRKPFPIASLIDTLANEFGVMADGDVVNFRCRSSRCWVNSDEQMLRRILQNFLSNALRYTRRGKVLLGCRRRGDQLLLEVWDTGPGIAESDSERIFEEFERVAGNENSSHEKGLGLGLSIARRMAILLGHKLEMQSREGRGSVFRVTVPVVSASREDRALPVVEYVGNELRDLLVLCIDNEQMILLGTQSLLEQWGCRVICAASLVDAIERCPPDSPPDLVLADFHLDAGENGLDVLQALGYHWQRQLAAIVISADDSASVCRQVKEAGHLYLSKPVQPAALRNSMRSLVRQKVRAVSGRREHPAG